MNPVQNISTDTRPNPASESDAPLVIRNVRVAEALARFAGDEERYRHWLLEFVGHGPSAVNQIRQAITNGSVETAINLVHALKGRTGMLGMSELHSIALSLEMTLKNREPTNYWLEELENSAVEMSRDVSMVLRNRTD
jgi:HPt (histidine-containing phosphotransfer) domain-containing protein